MIADWPGKLWDARLREAEGKHAGYFWDGTPASVAAEQRLEIVELRGDGDMILCRTRDDRFLALLRDSKQPHRSWGVVLG